MQIAECKIAVWPAATMFSSYIILHFDFCILPSVAPTPYSFSIKSALSTTCSWKNSSGSRGNGLDDWMARSAAWSK